METLLSAITSIIPSGAVAGAAIFFLKRYIEKNDESLSKLSATMDSIEATLTTKIEEMRKLLTSSNSDFKKISEELGKEVISVRVLAVDLKKQTHDEVIDAEKRSRASVKEIENIISEIDKKLVDHEKAFLQMKKILQAYRSELDDLKIRLLPSD